MWLRKIQPKPSLVLHSVAYAALVLLLLQSVTMKTRDWNGTEPCSSAVRVGSDRCQAADVGRFKPVDEMSDAEALRYLRWTNATSCSVSYDFGGRVLTYNKVTAIDGQKTVCMDAGVRPEPNRCVVYSFGINNDDWSFEDMIDQYGCHVYAFDPSMEAADQPRSERIRLYDSGLGTYDHFDGERDWNIRTLSTIYETLKEQHGDVPIDYLKVDIEDDEWAVLEDMLRSDMLANIRQMGVEIHFLDGNAARRHLGLVRSLEDAGLVRFAMRPKIYGDADLFGVRDRCCYEIAWYNPSLMT